MAEERREHETAIDAFWDQVAQGQAGVPGDVYPTDMATIRAFHALDSGPEPSPAFARQLREHLLQTPKLPLVPDTSLHTAATSSRSSGPRQPWSIPRRASPSRTGLAALATVALVVLTLLGSSLVFRGRLHPGRADERPVILPAVVATPAGAGRTREILLDTFVDALPAGHGLIRVEGWTLQPGSSAVGVPAVDGVFILDVQTGEITATQGQTQTPLVVGTPFPAAQQATAFRVTGADAATALGVYVYSEIAPTAVFQTDPAAHRFDLYLETSSDDLPGGTGRLVVERLTLSPGSALPAEAVNPLVWSQVGTGALGLTLEGKHLPFRWQSGDERTFRQGQVLPAVQPGTVMTMRNAGDEALVLYRVRITPQASAGSVAGTPAP